MQIATAADEPEPAVVISGANEFSKFIELPFEGTYDTIQSIVLKKSEWDEFIKKGLEEQE